MLFAVLSGCNKHSGLQVIALPVEHWILDLMADILLTHRTLKQTACYSRVLKPRNFVVAMRARLDVTERAIGAHGCLLWRDVATVDTLHASIFFDDLRFGSSVVAELV